jgi:hypothetical protein
MNDLLDILKAMAGKRSEVPDPMELFLDMAQRVVKFASSEFGTRPDEVAILMTTGDGKHLRFIAPRKFAELGTIPTTKRDSIAVSILSKKTGEAINNVPTVKHVSFFESIKLRDRVTPIQKMITVPIVHDGNPVGVAQVSRKGENPVEAGPDFTAADVKRAEQLFAAVAPYLAAARPDKF